MKVTFLIEDLEDNNLELIDTLPDGAIEISFRSANVQERYDLQACMVSHFSEIFNALGKNYHLVSEEHTMGTTKKRIDILAVDEKGHPVIMELKRGVSDSIMSQVMGYAGIMKEYGTGQDFLNFLTDTQAKKLTEFLTSQQVDLTELNRKRSVIAVDEDFDIKTLGTINWLNELTNQELQDNTIQNLNVSLYQAGENQYFTFAFEKVPTPIVAPTTQDDEIQDRDEVIAKMRTRNSAAADWLQSHVESVWYKKNNVVYFKKTSRTCKCWIQIGKIKVSHLKNHRFDEDEAFWTNNIDGIELSTSSKGLNFFLTTATQFAQFEKCRAELGWN